MECSVCSVRGPIGFCAVCRVLLCEHCGEECLACGRLVCPAHRQGPRTGEYICNECAPKVGAPPAAALSAVTPPKTPPRAAGSLSFDQLSAELGDVPYRGSAADEPLPERGEAPAEPSERHKHLRRKPTDDPKEFRVLTASAPQATPIWLSGLFAGGMACVLLLPVIKRSAFRDFQPWYSYAVMMMAFAAVFWSGYGLTRRKDAPTLRRLCLIGLVLGLFAGLVAFALRNPVLQR